MSIPASSATVTTALAALVADGTVDEVEAGVAEVLLRLTGETRAALARPVALAVAAPRRGDVCLDLATDEGAAMAEVVALLESSPTVRVAAGYDEDGRGPARPLVLRGGRLYLDRFDRAEGRVASALTELASRTVEVDADRLERALDRLLPEDAPGAHAQRSAARSAATRGLTVLTGGPGTGKTTTVARLLAVLLLASGAEDAPRIALAAPTGRAAARLTEAVLGSLGPMDVEPWVVERLRDAPGRTLHRLLGWRAGSPSRFLHDAARPLPFDVVVVDEASMVPIARYADLLAALAPTARLVVVGDRDQLAAVEAGNVLADLVVASDQDVPTGVVELRHAFRFPASGAIGATAALLRTSGTDAARLRAGLAAADPSEGEVVLVPPLDPTSAADPFGLGLPSGVSERIVAAFVDLARRAQDDEDPAELLRAVDRLRLLVPLRVGPEGADELDRRIARAVERRAPDEVPGPDGRVLPLGRPIMVTRNDPAIDLYNGDVGVVVRDPSRPDDPARRRIAFPGVDGVRTVPPARVPAHRTVHAATVHRSQGAQFDEVVLVLPRIDHPLVTR
ncbi:MAG: exodeoxyribonuclease subunit alpha, partial [Actinomycetota bacterium]